MRAGVAMGTAVCALVFALPSGAAPAPPGGTSGNDTCGYPASSFTESTVMRWAQLNGSGMNSKLVAFANDEKGLLLGVNGATADSSSPGHGSNVSGGSGSATDPSGRPFFPALYITDETTHSSSPHRYDFQNGGTPVNVNAGGPFVDDIFGSWSTASISGGKYTVSPPPAKNDWNLGSGADTPSGTSFTAMGNEGYGAEVRWNVSNLTDGAGNSLQPGDTYRIQVITHDGDQNKSGGDAGEFCVTLKIPGRPGISVLKLQRDGSSGSFTHNDLTVTEPSGSYVVHTIEYEIQATNTGNEPLTLSLSDPLCDGGTIQGPSSVSGKLVGSLLYPNGVAQYTCSHALLQSDPATFTNVGTVFGKPATGPTVHGTSQVTVHRQARGAKRVRRRFKHCRTPSGRRIRYRGHNKPAACHRPTRPPAGPPRGFTG